MTLDTVLYILIGVFYLAMAVLGGLMSSKDWKYKDWKYYTHTFITIAVITAILIFIQGLRIQKAQEDLTEVLQNIAKKQFPDLPPSEALKKLKQLEIRTTTLEQKTAYRDLTEAQKTVLTNGLSPYHGHHISLISVSGDSESQYLAEVFKEVFEEADWNVQGMIQGFFSAPVFTIIIEVGDSPPEAAAIIYDNLRAFNFEVVARRNFNLKSDEIILIIGSKKR